MRGAGDHGLPLSPGRAAAFGRRPLPDPHLVLLPSPLLAVIAYAFYTISSTSLQEKTGSSRRSNLSILSSGRGPRPDVPAVELTLGVPPSLIPARPDTHLPHPHELWLPSLADGRSAQPFILVVCVDLSRVQRQLVAADVDVVSRGGAPPRQVRFVPPPISSDHARSCAPLNPPSYLVLWTLAGVRFTALNDNCEIILPPTSRPLSELTAEPTGPPCPSLSVLAGCVHMQTTFPTRTTPHSQNSSRCCAATT